MRASQTTYILERDLAAQAAWSCIVFGPGMRLGVIDHIGKELEEIRKEPSNLMEWIDVVILAFDGALRAGHSPHEVIAAYHEKMARNRSRKWPDWRGLPTDQAIEHIRTEDA